MIALKDIKDTFANFPKLAPPEEVSTLNTVEKSFTIWQCIFFFSILLRMLQMTYHLEILLPQAQFNQTKFDID